MKPTKINSKKFQTKVLKNRAKICQEKRDKYLLQPPKNSIIKGYVANFVKRFLSNLEIKLYLTMIFNKKLKLYAMKLSLSQKVKVACQIAAKN